MSQTQTGGVILVVCLLFAVITAGQEISNDPAEVHCPAVLGVGVNTDFAFCDILIQYDAGLGARVVLPSHQGEATVSFNLHNPVSYTHLTLPTICSV